MSLKEAFASKKNDIYSVCLGRFVIGIVITNSSAWLRKVRSYQSSSFGNKNVQTLQYDHVCSYLALFWPRFISPATSQSHKSRFETLRLWFVQKSLAPSQAIGFIQPRRNRNEWESSGARLKSSSSIQTVVAASKIITFVEFKTNYLFVGWKENGIW